MQLKGPAVVIGSGEKIRQTILNKNYSHQPTYVQIEQLPRKARIEFFFSFELGAITLRPLTDQTQVFRRL